MISYIVYVSILYILYRFYPYFHTAKTIYGQYKMLVDPENKNGHFYAIKKLYSLVTSVSSEVKKPSQHEFFNKKYIKIPFHYGDQTYYYLLKIPKNVIPIRTITDENGNDIYDEIFPYLGPNLDCYGQTILPLDFGYKEVRMTTVLDREIVFRENDLIRM